MVQTLAQSPRYRSLSLILRHMPMDLLLLLLLLQFARGHQHV
jgi:hypothetical protein